MFKVDWKWRALENFKQANLGLNSDKAIESLVPIDRRGHSAVWVEALSAIVIYGGTLGFSKLLGDIVIVKPRELLWEVVEIQPSENTWVPAPRSWHSSVNLGRFLYIFGGLTDEGPSSELLQFDLEKRIWALMIVSPVTDPIYAGSLIKKTPNSFLILGGMGPDDQMNPMNQAWEFSELDAEGFSKVPVSNLYKIDENALIRWAISEIPKTS